MSVVSNQLFHCFRHCSVQKIRPKFLKAGLYCDMFPGFMTQNIKI